ncbi:hypothetical protein Salat_1847800 [Sesamum alatum]|uniref:Phorbol-ester/DAG-type domain-containing protein n=1 Tax=Sesamum alatum TaxID=300844 RepID=A0AAE1Y403_9LAMI|nr:hypothetical protein Salat_1847800 [Sesamum alatum]
MSLRRPGCNSDESINKSLRRPACNSDESINKSLRRSACNSDESINKSLRKPACNSDESINKSLRRPACNSDGSINKSLRRPACNSDGSINKSLRRPACNSEESINKPLRRSVCNSDGSINKSLRRPACNSDESIYKSLRRPTCNSDESINKSLRRPACNSDESINKSLKRLPCNPEEFINKSIRRPACNSDESINMSLRRLPCNPEQSINKSIRKLPCNTEESIVKSIRRLSCNPDESINKSIRTHNCYEHYELKSYQKLFTCDGCKTNGFGERFQCQLCGHELHRECRFPQTTISHEFFGSSTLTFRNKPLTRQGENNRKEYSKCCNACGKDICGFSYHCEADNLDLHPTCRKLDRKLVINDTVFDLRPAKVSSSKCIWCKNREMSDGMGVPGWSYLSTCKNYHFHVCCMTEMVYEACMKNGEMGLEKIELRQLVRHNGLIGSNSVSVMIKSFLKITLSALLGDPTLLISNVFVELVSHGLQ